LDDETRVFPGHKEDTTIGDERRSNPFIRAWLDGEGLVSEPCRVNGEDATLLLWAPDYDGGNKALVRLGSGLETIVGGSRVERRWARCALHSDQDVAGGCTLRGPLDVPWVEPFHRNRPAAAVGDPHGVV